MLWDIVYFGTYVDRISDEYNSIWFYLQLLFSHVLSYVVPSSNVMSLSVTFFGRGQIFEFRILTGWSSAQQWPAVIKNSSLGFKESWIRTYGLDCLIISGIKSIASRNKCRATLTTSCTGTIDIMGIEPSHSSDKGVFAGFGCQSTSHERDNLKLSVIIFGWNWILDQNFHHKPRWFHKPSLLKDFDERLYWKHCVSLLPYIYTYRECNENEKPMTQGQGLAGPRLAYDYEMPTFLIPSTI